MQELCTIHKDFFSYQILKNLSSLLDAGPVRKHEYNLVEKDVPKPISDAAFHATSVLGYEFNSAILKWYKVSDDYRSGAFDFHVDPQRFQSLPLILVTVSGFATLEYKEPDGKIISVPCAPNQLVILRSDLEHRVSQPQGPSGQREFLFLGFDSGSS